MKKSKIVYSLNAEDLQRVAVEEFGRELRDDEIEKVADALGEKINWYDAILEALAETIEEPARRSEEA